MPLSRIFWLVLLCGALLAQQTSVAPQKPARPASEDPDPTMPDLRITTTVDVVTTPVTVYDHDGKYVQGLQPEQFHLFDNEKEQNIQVDVTYVPISLVVVLECSSRAEAVLPKIQRTIGSLIQPLVVGDQGEVAVVAYDHRLRVMQEFTSDSNKISEAVKKIQPGSMSSRLIDAVYTGARLLKTRPANRRRIMLVVGETRDYGSSGRLREALINLQLNNITYYSVNISRMVTTLTQKAPPARPDHTPPAARPLPSGVPATPNTVMQAWGGGGTRAEFLPLLIELLRDVKAVFRDNPTEAFTKGTGGREYGFIKQSGLEDAITAIGTELHSQYLVTYNPNNRDEGGFHKIVVQVSGHPEYKLLTRPGYWLAMK